MIPLIQHQCVQAGWLTESEFLEAYAAANALPGPISTKMALYIGYHEAGVFGAMSAFAGVLLPSSLLMALLTGVLLRHKEHPWVIGALKGAKPAVIGMLVFVAWRLAPAGLHGYGAWMLALGAFAALLARVHPAFVMVGAMLAGILLFRP